ncbi:hypothetical protein BM28_A0999 [Brucella melitensis M28]|nr:hypothetical protein BM28_A0999 [Brucella melitensis M28]
MFVFAARQKRFRSCYRRAAQMHMVFHSAKQSKISMSDPSLRQGMLSKK